MAPNGTSRKTPVPTSKPSSNFIAKALLESTIPDSGKIKLKLKPSTSSSLNTKACKPSNYWDPSSTLLPTPPTAPITDPSSPIALSFSHGHPLSDRADIIKCSHCKRAILRHRAKGHIEQCIAKKQEKQRRKKEAKDARDAAARKAERGGVSSSSSSEDEDEDGTAPPGVGESGSKKTATKKTTTTMTGGATAGQSAGKKRKMEVSEEGGPKKKKKKEEPSKAKVKVKAPVDVERQCGVELPQGGQCARSLTCKSHSMGAKRAVPGRSAPYDKLLAEYQRKNQAKLQKAAMESAALPADDALEGPIDSDEEKDHVMAAIARARPTPLFQPQLVPLRRKYTYVRLKEMLGNALGGRGGGLFAPGPPGAAPAPPGPAALGFGVGVGHAMGSARGSVDGGRRGSEIDAVGEVVMETSVQG